MELNISEKNYILPMAMVGQSKVFKIVAHDESTDCLLSEEKETKDGKGKFLQFELALQDEHGENHSARYLLSGQIKPLVVQWGQKSEDWINQYVVVSGMPEEKGTKTYYKLHFLPSGIPEWAEEVVI